MPKTKIEEAGARVGALPQDALTPRELVRVRPDGYSLRTLANMRSRSSGPPYFKQGPHVYYSLGEYDAWLAARKKPPVYRVEPKSGAPEDAKSP